MLDRGERAGPSWAFGKIAIAPPERPPSSGPGLNRGNLAVAAVNDPLEREADRIAERVMRMPAHAVSVAPTQVQRRCAECELEANSKQAPDGRLAKGEQDDELLGYAGPAPGASGAPPVPEQPAPATPEQETAVAKTGRRLLRKESAAGVADGSGTTFAPGIVEQVLQTAGQPLEARARADMERRFGYDFSLVRVHVGPQASASAEAIQADAYTVGHDIVFRAGRHDPGSLEGQRLLAHELAHVVQQGRAAPSAPGADRGVSTAGPVARRVQRAVTTAVAKDGAPSHALSGCTWGLTFPESVDETCVAAKSGATWKADPTNLLGHFSEQTRLVPPEVEVTGPGGNTTAGNYCDQVGELKRLGDCPGKWYMLAAVVAHENVHAAHFGPALAAAAPNITADFNGVTVPDAPGKTDATALTELKALPAYAAAKGQMQPKWLTQVLALAKGDHAGPAAAAEHTVVDPMITNICSHAKTNKWAACADCPP